MSQKTEKEFNEGLEKQKQLIKETINPFFKNNGFLRKGTKYLKKLDYFIIEIEIQRQRYYKDEGIENFRINMRVFSENSDSMTFGWYSIAGENSWITTDKNTNIDELKSWLNIELNKLPMIFEKYNDVDGIIKEQKNIYHNDGIVYAFLLKDNNKTAEFEKWLENTKKNIEKLNSEIFDLSKKLELIEKNYGKRKNELLKDIEYNILWRERKAKEWNVQSIQNFLRKMNV